jgi:hypothetical protein
VLQLFRANSPYTVIILFILTLLLKLQALHHPAAPAAVDGQVIYAWVLHGFQAVLGTGATTYTILALLMTFGQAIYLRGVSIRHRLFSRPSYLPAFAFVLLSSLHPVLGSFSPPLLANWLIIGALDTVLGFTSREEERRRIFNAGFLLGLAAALVFPDIVYAIFLVLTLILLRPFRPGEWVVAALGYLTPFYFAAGLLFLIDKLGLAKVWPGTGLNFPHLVRGYYYPWILIAGLAPLLIAGIYVLVGNLARLPVATRRGWGAVICALITGITAALIAPARLPAAWAGVLPALSLLVIPPLATEKRSRFATFAFYFLILLIICCQLTVRI